jgi:catechol 2,3-dioxygenase-like lactoylglutathione lyase family enzyme/nitrite reductase/ring-hydroxylating ferredoxin subunit
MAARTCNPATTCNSLSARPPICYGTYMALVVGLNHLLIEVSDLDISETFYNEVFGFDIVGRNLVAEDGPNSLLKAARGHMILLVEVANVTPFRLNSESIHHAFYLREEQYRRVIERRTAAGFPVTDTREEMRAKGELSFDVYDPDGHRYQVQSIGRESSEALMARDGWRTCGKTTDFSIGSVTPFPEWQFYLIRHDGGFLAVSQWCSHMNGKIDWRGQYWDFYCPFHAATFDRRGVCTGHGDQRKYPPLRTHPVRMTDDGDVMVDTNTLVKRNAFSDAQLAKE